MMNETDRLEAFSDAVMAVIITIMAFNVKPPAAASLSAVRASMPELLVTSSASRSSGRTGTTTTTCFAPHTA